MYSQNNEEALILAHFNGRIGRFLDLGASNGISLSNTLALAERGWCGVCVEASPIVAAKLREAHRTRPSILCIEAAVIPSRLPPEPIVLFDTGGEWINTVDPVLNASWNTASGRTPAQVKVTALRIETLMDATTGEFTGYDFVNIDVEGLSVEVLFDLWDVCLATPELICVEHEGKLDQILGHPTCDLYREIGRNAENLLLARG